MQALQKLHDAVRRKQSYNWQGQWFNYHDKSRSHTSLVIQYFLAETNIVSSLNHRILWISFQVIFAVPYSEDRPPEDTFCNHREHQIECDDQTSAYSKETLSSMLSTKAGLMEQECVLCVCVCV
jgi:hypothetical protein